MSSIFRSQSVKWGNMIILCVFSQTVVYLIAKLLRKFQIKSSLHIKQRYIEKMYSNKIVTFKRKNNFCSWEEFIPLSWLFFFTWGDDTWILHQYMHNYFLTKTWHKYTPILAIVLLSIFNQFNMKREVFLAHNTALIWKFW